MDDTATDLGPWARLVLKDGVALGGLPRQEQQQALALVWSALPQAAPCSEREMNQRLQACLAGAACWLDTDHVELRRWLADAGWLQRDGYGHQYRVPPRAELAPGLQACSAALKGLDTAVWVAEQRTAHRAQRAARRAAWQARQADRAA